MGGGSSPAGQTTSTQQSAPWAGQAPYLSEQFQGAQGLYQGAGPQYYPSSTYAPLTLNQQNIANAIQDWSANGGLMPHADNAVGNMLDTGTSWTQGAFGTGQNLLGNEMNANFINPSANLYNNYAPALSNMTSTGFTAPSRNTYGVANNTLANNASSAFTAPAQGTYGSANSTLANELSPGYLNPWNSGSFQTVVNNTLASVLPATTASFVNGNRSDSGLAQRAATMAATDAVGNLAQQQYNTNQQIQQNAAQQASSNYLNQVGLQNQAANQAASNYAAMLGLQQGAGQQAASNYLNLLGVQNNAAGQAASNFLNQQNNILKGAAVIPGLDQQHMADAQLALNAAGLNQQNQQNIINADVNRWNYYNNLPYQQLGNYANMIGGNYGGTSTLSQPYYENQGANIMSGITGALGLGNAGAQAAGFSGLFPMIGSIFGA